MNTGMQQLKETGNNKILFDDSVREEILTTALSSRERFTYLTEAVTLMTMGATWLAFKFEMDPNLARIAACGGMAGLIEFTYSSILRTNIRDDLSTTKDRLAAIMAG